MSVDLDELLEHIGEVSPDAVVFTGFDAAIVGIGVQFGHEPVLVYDRDRCIEILMADGATDLEAQEYLEVNMMCLSAGSANPVFLETLNTRLARPGEAANSAPVSTEGMEAA